MRGKCIRKEGIRLIGSIECFDKRKEGTGTIT
jgi:hypothetical protein